MHQRTIALIEALMDGVTAHLTTQARSGLWPAYSEYLLYAPIVTVASHLKWRVNCEYKLPKKRIGAGDNPRLDFMIQDQSAGLAVAMEVKWPRDPRGSVSVAKDIAKLRAVIAPEGVRIDTRILFVAGPHEIRSDSEPILRPKLTPKGLERIKVRALGAGKRAWGTSVFLVEV